MLPAILSTLLLIIDLVYFVIIASVIVSWLLAFDMLNTRQPVIFRIVSFLQQITEPIYRPLRRFIPPLGGVDVTPIVVLIIIYFLKQLILNI